MFFFNKCAKYVRFEPISKKHGLTFAGADARLRSKKKEKVSNLRKRLIWNEQAAVNQKVIR